MMCNEYGELNMVNIKEQLQNELDQLQSKFNTGHELTLHYLPGQYRTGQNGKNISGEVQGHSILIYDEDPNEAVKTLYHEFLEYLISPIIKQHMDVINHQNQIISQLLYGKREEVVERLCRSLLK
jgi:hypothetical protein